MATPPPPPPPEPIPDGAADQSDAPAIDQLLPDPLPTDPFAIFHSWFDEAHRRADQPNPNAMSLATVDSDGAPSARIVLCKAIHADPGFVVFYTNHTGRKGVALEASPVAGVCFHWDHLDRQVRMEGLCVRSPDEESDAYFASRPWLSRVGAWASDQSEPIASRAALAEKLDDAMRRFGIDPANPPAKDASGIEIPRPPHWGGFRLFPTRLELWVGARGRLHDRAAWTRQASAASPHDFEMTSWSATRLQP